MNILNRDKIHAGHKYIFVNHETGVQYMADFGQLPSQKPMYYRLWRDGMAVSFTSFEALNKELQDLIKVYDLKNIK